MGRIENYIREQYGAGKINNNQIDNYQLEHIFPQTADNGLIPNEFADKNEYNTYVNMIGNLTLLEPNINQSLNKSNKITEENWFHNKIRAYSISDIKLTKTISNIDKVGINTAWNQFANSHLMEFTEWNKNKVILRQAILGTLIKEIWNVSDI